MRIMLEMVRLKYGREVDDTSGTGQQDEAAPVCARRMTGFIVSNIEDFVVSFKLGNPKYHIPETSGPRRGVSTLCGIDFEGRRVWLDDPDDMGDGDYGYFAECGILCSKCARKA